MSQPRFLAVRLSALGDVVLAQAALDNLRRSRPDAEITWVIDQRFRAFAEAIPGIRVVAIEKPTSLREYLSLRQQLRGQTFSAVLAMQANLRVNLLYPAMRAPRKIGFDPRRARDLHHWFITESIERRDEHLLDGFRQFVAKLGAALDETARWPAMPSAPEVVSWWEQRRPHAAYIAVQMGASKLERCWPAQRYAELARFFAGNPNLGVVLTGGNSNAEREAARAFERECTRALNLQGQTDLNQLRHILRGALAVISPDTAAVHLARADDVPVVGLYAVARSALSGPYRETEYTVDKYAEAVAQLAKRDPAQVDWHFRVHDPAAMNLITATEVWTNLQRALFERSRSREF